MKYIKSYADNAAYEAAKASADFLTPNVGYIEDTKEVKYLNSKKDFYNIYGTLTGDSATAEINIHGLIYSVSPSGSTNEFGLVFNKPVRGVLSFNPKAQFNQYVLSLKSIEKIDVDTSDLSSMRQMFYRCQNITSIDMSSVNTSSVTSMEQMFAYCNALTTLDVSNFNTSAVTNMNNMFRNCTALTTVTMNNTNQTTFGMIKAQLVTDNVASHVTIIRDGHSYTYNGSEWVEA